MEVLMLELVIQHPFLLWVPPWPFGWSQGVFISQRGPPVCEDNISQTGL